MQILEDMNRCYGCAACANICPTGAITMAPEADGFLYPQIDQAKCVNCHKCQTVCPQLHATFDNAAVPAVYAIMAPDDVRALSASGGMFSLLADYAFARKGYVCGSAFAEDFRSAHHMMIDNPKDLDKLRRSKYIQSENGDIHKQVEAKLKDGRFVLFVGTPCQCAALKTYLRKPYENLLVVDLICHSTPSPLAWNKFLDEIFPNQAIKDVNFRYKELTGWSATTHVETVAGGVYTEVFKNCKFEQASSSNLISRKSCGTCQFARVPRQGDLTIGDFWGIRTFKKALDDRKGTSAIMINSPKGQQVFDALKAQQAFKQVESVPFYNAFARNNSNVYRFPQTHPGRQVFFDTLAEGGSFSSALAASKPKKYDIMLFSIWYAANYGSLMTNYALYQTLTDMGYNCLFADIPDHLWPTSQSHRDPLFVTRRFGYKHFQLTRKYKDRTDLKKANDLADTFLVGSDQIWNYSLCKSAGNFFFLDFVNDDKRKIAYGTSFGHNKFKGNEQERMAAGFYLNRFDAVSVREDYAVDLSKTDFGVDAVQVLDPVFMCRKEHYLNRVAESALKKNPPARKYVLAYVLDPTEEKQALLEDAAKRLDADLLCIPNAHVRADMRKNWRLPILENIDMEDWLYYFNHAEMVITDSFHGSCFSIIFEKPFIAIGNKRRGLNRFYSLLGKLGLLDRLILSADEAPESLFTTPIDYAAVNATLAILREESMAWLQNALATPAKAPVYSAYDLVDRRIDQLTAQMEKRLAELAKQIDSALAAQPIKLDKPQPEAPTKNEAALRAQIDDLNRKLAKQHADFERREKHLLNQIALMENSMSWRVTKPLRTLKATVQKTNKES